MNKKIIAAIISLTMLFSVIPFGASAAKAADIPQIYAITVSPSETVINTVVTYTIITDQSAISVAVKNIDGSIHTLANIDAGFTNYADEGENRIWTLSKRCQIPQNAPRIAVASGNSGKLGGDMYSDYAIVKMSAQSAPVEPWEPPVGPPDEKEMGIVAGSFIQPWLFLDWTQERWNQEFSLMKELDMQYVIIQNAVNLNYATDGNAYGQDYSKYAKNTGYCYSIYPSALPELSGMNNGKDQLAMCLDAAKQNDMQVIIGLNGDNRWWLYGWGNPELKSGETDYVTGSYFADWCAQDADLSVRMAEEIWNNYGQEYGEQIYAWYYWNEIWNIDIACAGTDNGIYAQLLGNSLNAYIDGISAVTPLKPLVLSPFFNPTMSTAEQYGQMWQDVFEVANFRSYDVFAPQDCVGNNMSYFDQIPNWIANLASAAEGEGVRFWTNNENFTSGGTSAEVSRVIQQIENTEQYSEHNIMFSWNHYYSPALNSSYQAYHDSLLAYVRSRAEQE